MDTRNENSDCPSGLQLSVIEEEGCVSHHLNQHSALQLYLKHEEWSIAESMDE